MGMELNSMHHTRVITAVIAAIAVCVGLSAPAHGDVGPGMEERVESVMDRFPGGTQTAWNEVSWDGGAIVLTLAPSMGGATVETARDSAAMDIGNCLSGRFCVYSQAYYGGNRVMYTGCATYHSITELGSAVRSIANARGFGTVTAKNGSTSVLRVPPLTGTNTTAAITHLTCA